MVLHLVVSSCHLAGISTPVFGCDCQAFSSHCRRLCLSWSSTGSSPVLSRISVFRSMFQQVTLRTSLKHLIWNVFSFRMSCLVTGQVSAPYKRTDITKVRKACILVVMLMFLLRRSTESYAFERSTKDMQIGV